MEKKYNFKGEENITISRGDGRFRISLYATSLGISGEQKAELESMFDALTATVDAFIDENAENIGKIFPETTED
jgi:hypothetical protein